MRRVRPTPMIAPEMECVVDTGTPQLEAVRITVEAAASAANPCSGLSLIILWPRVLMMRQPPDAVPSAMAPAQESFTHSGT